MKCIKNPKGQIFRVSDYDADVKVTSGKYEYCGKEEWKKATRK